MPGLLAFAQLPSCSRARAIFDIPTANLQARAGSQVNLRKTRAWNAGGVQPRSSWSLPPGLVVLGPPQPKTRCSVALPCRAVGVADTGALPSLTTCSVDGPSSRLRSAERAVSCLLGMLG